MEHIGKHFESAEREKKDRGEGDEDLELRAWALEQGIVVDCGPRGYWLAGLQDERDSRKAVPVTRAKRGKNFEGGDEDAIGDDE